MTEAEWKSCQNGAEMLRVAEGVDRKLLVAAACACARLALPYVPPGEERPLRAIEAAEGWVRGEVGIEAVREAAKAAWFASAARPVGGAGAAADAADLASDAAYAADADAAISAAADVAISAAATAISVAVAAYYAHAAVAAGSDAREKTLAQCADIVREIIPYRLVAVAVLEDI